MNLKQKIVVVFLVALMVLPLYAGIVDVVNALQGHDLIESLELRSDRKLNVTNVFDIGDTLIVAATSGLADRYELEIYCNSSSVFVQSGAFNEGSAQIPVPLNPPEFLAGSSYLVVFVAYAYDYPIPGAWTSDTIDSSYMIIAVDTEIDLWVGYDSSIGSLSLNASLATVDGFPIPDEQIGFALQFNKHRRNEGWIPLTSMKTKSDGSARTNLAFGLPDGNYYIKAFHKANGNFGGSENKTEIGIFSNVAFRGLDSGSSSAFSISSFGNLTLSVSSPSPYVLLPTNATASYVSDTPLPGPWNRIFFYFNNIQNGAFREAEATVTGGPPYVYETSIIWNSSATGFHKLIAGIVSGDGKVLPPARENGIGLIAIGEVNLDIQRCPSNIVLDFPEAFYGGVAPVTVAVSQPRPYQASYDNFSSSFSLAPQFSYNGATYAMDEGAESVPVHLYVNDNQVLTNSTDVYGLVNFPVTWNFTSVRLKAAVDNCSIFLAEPVERVASFSRVRVYDNRTAFDSSFKLNYTVNGLFGGGELYVDVDNPVRVEASLLNQSAMNIPVAVMISKFVSSSQTQPGSPTPLPYGSNYLRVNNTIALGGDVNADGKVDGKDIAIVTKAYGSRPGEPKWKVDADLNHDNKVDGKDSAIVSQNYGKIGDRVIFNSGQTIYVDSQGVAGIPAGASSLTFYRNSQATSAFIEFFFAVLNQTYLTNNLGQALTTWKPLSLGRYLTQFKLLRKFDLTITPQTSITGLDASTNLVAYFDVVKRPIELSIDYEPSQPTLDDEVTMYASCVDTALGEYVAEMPVSFYVSVMSHGHLTDILLGSPPTNSSGIATVSWYPRDYKDANEDYGHFGVKANVTETAVTTMAENWISVDARYPTRLEFLGGEVINATMGQPIDLTVRLVRVDDGSPIVNRLVWLSINFIEMNWFETGADGTFTWSWAPNATTYWMSARFKGDPDYKPSNEAKWVIFAEVVPVFVEFNVQPREFELNSSITLTAKVLNASNNLPLVDYSVTFYAVYESGTNSSIGVRTTNASGIAVLPHTYMQATYAFRVRVGGSQPVISNPILLTVAKESSVFLNVTRYKDSFKHMVSGYLLSKSEPVEGKRVKIFVNGTEYLERGIVYTGNDGIFRREITLDPKDNKPTSYQLTVSFEGDNPSNVTAYEYTPNGTRYAACTTIRYGLKPSSNTVMLTVEPPATQAAAATPDATVTQTPESTTVAIPPAKTPEQIQQEAEQKGWLLIEPEFSWWFPWFRLHVKLNVNLPQGNPNIDYGWSFLPFGESFSANDEVIADILDEFASLEFKAEILMAPIITLLLQYIVARVAGMTGVGVWAAIAMYASLSVAQAVASYYLTGQNRKSWLGAFLASAISATLGLVIAATSVVRFATGVARYMLYLVDSVMKSLNAMRLNFFDITGIAFVIVDFALMVGYLALYLA